MVSPGNPLKAASGMAPLEARLRSAMRIADGRRIIATDIERRLGTTYTATTLAALRRRFPAAEFVWLMGADNLSQLPRWGRWREIVRTMPMLVLPRPGETRHALAGRAAACLRAHRLPARAAVNLARTPAPAWILLPMRENPASATAMRARAANWRQAASLETVLSKEYRHNTPTHPLRPSTPGRRATQTGGKSAR